MKKFLATFAILLFLMASQAFPSEYVEGEVLVVLDVPTSAKIFAARGNRGEFKKSLSERADGLARRHRAKASATFPEIAEVSGRNIVHLRSETKSTKELVEELKNNPEVQSVQPNYIMHLMATPNDYGNTTWGMGKINAPLAWDTTSGDASVIVAVMDTGINSSHADLSANMVNNATDIDGHGTHVAGIIGAVGNNSKGVTGVNWKVGLLSVNVFTASGGKVVSYISDQIKAINDILDQKKNKSVNIRVVNMSFGGWFNDAGTAYGNAVKSMSDAEIIVVFAAGNEYQNISSPWGEYNGNIVFPASYRFKHSITVGSTNQSDVKSNSSNYGPRYVHIAAPGEGIYSTLSNPNNNSYGNMSGTSMAAPFVAGAAALLCAAYPGESAMQIKSRLLNEAEKIGTSYWQYGRLNVANALTVTANKDEVYSDESFPLGTFSAGESQTASGGGGGCSVFGAFAVILLLIPIFLRSSRV